MYPMRQEVGSSKAATIGFCWGALGHDRMNLQLLDFDVTEDTEGVVCWDALACPEPGHNPDLLHEVAQVLVWAWRFTAQEPGPIEDGADWDYDLQATFKPQGQEPVPVRLQFDPVSGQISWQQDLDDRQAQGQHAPDFSLNCRMELSLSMSGTPGFADAFRAKFTLP